MGEAGVDLVLIQSLLRSYVNPVVLMQTSIFFSMIFIRNGKRFIWKQGQPRPQGHVEARVLFFNAELYNGLLSVARLPQKVTVIKNIALFPLCPSQLNQASASNYHEKTVQSRKFLTSYDYNLFIPWNPILLTPT